MLGLAVLTDRVVILAAPSADSHQATFQPIKITHVVPSQHKVMTGPVRALIIFLSVSIILPTVMGASAVATGGYGMNTSLGDTRFHTGDYDLVLPGYPVSALCFI